MVFPSSGGRFYEYEDFKMIEELAPFIEEGKCQFFCVDSIDKETWLNVDASDDHISSRHEEFHDYIIEEVVPFIYEQCGGKKGITTTGCSMGAFHAANFYFRKPDVFDSVIALSGLYSVKYILNRDYNNEGIYFNSPLGYLKNMEDARYLDLYRKGKIIICVGQGAWEDEMRTETDQLRTILNAKGVGARIEFWGFDVNHDWPWWRKQIAYFLPDVL